MGEVIAGFGVSHAPGIKAWPEGAPADQFSKLEQGFAALRQQIEALKPDAIVFVTPEHWVNFSLANMPAFCVGMAEKYEGPVEPWLRVPPATVPGARALGRHLVDRALEDGVDVSFSYELKLDHATMVPLSYLTPSFDVPVVPIIQNCLVEPMPTPRRSFALGQSIRRAIRESDWRVIVLGSGGLSHWPGEREHGKIDQEFDQRFLEVLRVGRGQELANWTHQEIAKAGTGAAEVRNWITMTAATEAAPVDVLVYEPIPAFATGCAIASTWKNGSNGPAA